MKIEELKEKVLTEIENNLWRLGDDGEDSVFPNFDLNSHELEYGVQRDDYGINIETKAKTEAGGKNSSEIECGIVCRIN